ncbi:MAG: hypothetical protein U0235_03095 [Polyangiaceae bacterium]
MMPRRHAIFCVLGLVGCSRSAPAETQDGPQVETVTLVVSDDATRLGSFVLAPGKPGVLTLERTDGRASELKAACDAINAKDAVTVKMDHETPSREYVMEGHSARRGTSRYPHIVQLKLMSEGFTVSR